MPDKALSEIAAEVHAATAGLAELLKRYPDREEVEKRFVNKAQSRSRFVLVVVMVLIAMVVSAFMTVSTVSVCFLGGQTSNPGICHIMPGYSSAIKQNRLLLKQFRALVAVTQSNRKIIAKQQREIRVLEGR